jgi:hypothetical protein
MRPDDQGAPGSDAPGNTAPTVPGGDTLTRRTFVQAGAATVLTAASWRRVWGSNERVGVGFIGYGLIGKRHVLDFQEQKDADLVAVAEVHSGRRDEALAQIGGQARGYADFRLARSSLAHLLPKNWPFHATTRSRSSCWSIATAPVGWRESAAVSA